MDIGSYIDKIGHNITVVATLAIIVFILVSTVVLGGFYYMQSEDSTVDEINEVDETNEIYGLYEYVPVESNFVLQSNNEAIRNNNSTKNVSNKLQNNISKKLNTINNSTLINYNIQDIDNKIIFASFDDTDDTQMNISKIGMIIEISMTKKEIQKSIKENKSTKIKYKNQTIYHNTDKNIFITVLGGNITITDTEEFMKTIIDTKNGEKEYINKELIPDNGTADEIWIGINNMNILSEELQNNSLIINNINELPKPHTITVNYKTNNINEIKLDTQFKLDSLESASKVNRAMKNTNTEIQTDITLDKKTVYIEQKMPLNTLISKIMPLFNTYDEKISNTDTPKPTVFIKQLRNNKVNIEVLEVGNIDKFNVINHNKEIVGTIDAEYNSSETYINLDSPHEYDIHGILANGTTIKDIDIIYKSFEEINNLTYGELIDTEINNTTNELEIIINGYKDISKFIIIDHNGNIVDIISKSDTGSTYKYPDLNESTYTIIGESDAGSEYIIKSGDYINDTNTNETRFESGKTSMNTKLNEDTGEIDILVVKNERFDNFQILNPDGDIIDIIDGQIGNVESYPNLNDGSYGIIGISESGYTEVIKEQTKKENTIISDGNTTNDSESDTSGDDMNLEDDNSDTTTDDNSDSGNDTQIENNTTTSETVSNTTQVSEKTSNNKEYIEITVDENELVEEFVIIDPDGISYTMSSEVGTTNEYPYVENGSYKIVGILEDGSEEVIKTVNG
jgi:hypothetical protein